MSVALFSPCCDALCPTFLSGGLLVPSAHLFHLSSGDFELSLSLQ